MGTKSCSKCGVVKAFAEFHKASTEKSGFRAACKSCIALRYQANKDRFKENSAAWYAANKDRKAETVTAWREKNPDFLSSYSAEYYQKNKEKRTKQIKVWRSENRTRLNELARIRTANNPAKERERHRRYARENPAKMVTKVEKRRAVKFKATPAWANLEKIASVYEEAARLTRETGVLHHVDHIVPLKSKLVCGFHVENNLEVLDASSNCSKGNWRWPDMP